MLSRHSRQLRQVKPADTRASATRQLETAKARNRRGQPQQPGRITGTGGRGRRRVEARDLQEGRAKCVDGRGGKTPTKREERGCCVDGEVHPCRKSLTFVLQGVEPDVSRPRVACPEQEGTTSNTQRQGSQRTDNTRRSSKYARAYPGVAAGRRPPSRWHRPSGTTRWPGAPGGAVGGSRRPALVPRHDDSRMASSSTSPSSSPPERRYRRLAEEHTRAASGR